MRVCPVVRRAENFVPTALHTFKRKTHTPASISSSFVARVMTPDAFVAREITGSLLDVVETELVIPTRHELFVLPARLVIPVFHITPGMKQ